MKTYLTLGNQLRIETDPEIIATLERKGWVNNPPPAHNPETQSATFDGEWHITTNPLPTTTAEEHLAASGYTPLRLLTCLDLEGKLRAAGATSAPLAAVRQWLDTLTLAAAANPDDQRPDWPPAPHQFPEVLADALTALTAP
jgi:hypothetical protein